MGNWPTLSPNGNYLPSVKRNQQTPTDPYAPSVQQDSQAPPIPQSSGPDPIEDMYLPRLESALQPPHISGTRQFFGALVGNRNPQLGGLITGETQRQRNIQSITGQIGAAQQERTNELGAENVESQIQARNAQSNQVPISLPNGQAAYLPGALAEKYIQNQQTVAGRSQVAQTNKRYIPVAGVGVVDTQNPQGASVIPGTQQGITITPEIAQDYQMPQQFIGKPMKLSDLASFQRGQDFQNTIAEGQNGPAIVNRRTGVATPLGLGNPSMGHGVQVADPNSPGNTKYEPMGQAIAEGAPGTSSAAVQVPRQAAKAAVPTKTGDLSVAFNTAIQHAELYKQALTALNSGDVRALNSIKNSFETQFGSPLPTNAQAIINAYRNEVASGISKGHMTDREVADSGATLPLNASPAQALGALDAYEKLFRSKIDAMNAQTKAAVNASQPGGPPPGARVRVFNPQTGKLE